MDPRNLSKDDVRFLELLGGFADFIAQRCQYLIEHPDGAGGRAISFAESTMELGVLIRGAVLQLFSEIGCRLHDDLSHVADFDMPTTTSLTIGFRLEKSVAPAGPGARVL